MVGMSVAAANLPLIPNQHRSKPLQPPSSTKGRRWQMRRGALVPFSTGSLGYFPKIAPKSPLRLVFSSRYAPWLAAAV